MSTTAALLYYDPRSSRAEDLTLSRRAAQYLCFGALLFASSDVWPTIQIGFTFRLPQLFMYLCVPLLLPTIRHRSIESFPGSTWCLLWVLWTAVSLPFSLMINRSIGYAFWLASDLMIIFVFTQAFRTPSDAKKLVNWLLLTFVILSFFGILQMFAGVLGFGILVSEWWVKGLLPRVNGLSYEPSYYATYLLPGWVLSNYLLSKKVDVGISRTLLQVTAISSTVALVISTSRMGWGLMLAWVALRGGVALIRFLLGKKTTPRSLRRTVMWFSLVPIVILILAITETDRFTAALENMAWLFSGLGLFGQASHSADNRSGGMVMTWNAFLAHPILGTGLGAVPVEIAAQQGVPIVSLEDAKSNEGMSVAIEMLASIGLVGFFIVAGFISSLAFKYRVAYASADVERKAILRGMSWALGWLILALQLNQNFLRIYVWMDTAILTCLISIYSKHASLLSAKIALTPTLGGDHSAKRSQGT